MTNQFVHHDDVAKYFAQLNEILQTNHPIWQLLIV